jgi:hypothetical protein
LRLPDFDWRNPFANLVAFSDCANPVAFSDRANPVAFWDRIEARESSRHSRPTPQTIVPVN